ncbi:MAG TPA: methionyl-tRNA formyltransferase [Arcobacter sp.]|nr:methionyl-tRNA formyltransferase [Arcobacter sp.]HIP56341.1 methionyl-tRNA formyltransferase [Arcobacter sp.]
MNKKIIFMGTPEYATVILKELVKQNYELQALFTQADKKVGRKQILTAPHIKQYVIDEQINIPIYQPETLRQEGLKEIIQSFNPDFIIVAAYGQILPQNILDIAPCINLHASLLPLYRGASPIQQCLLNADEYTGVTAMYMEAGLDSGDIIGLKYLKIQDEMDVEYLFDKLAYIAASLIVDVLENFSNIKEVQQNNTKVSHCGKIKKEDGEVLLDNAFSLVQKYKAFKFWPGLFLENGLKLKDLSLCETESENIAGTILDIQKDKIVIACTKGSINLTMIQQPSKKAILATDYIRGQRLELGNTLS